jgi:ABC-type multidrug transport system fused ATPase/permease subunit
MGNEFNSSVIAIFPILILLFYLVLLAVGFFALYLVIRNAINNSKLNHNVEQLRIEISRMNEQLQRNKESITTSEEHKEY